MKLTKDLSNKLYAVLDKAKKVSRLSFTKEEFDNYINTINVINSLDGDDTQVNNKYNLSRYEVPTAFKDIIVPSELKFNKGSNFRNLLSREEYSVEASELDKVLSPTDFNLISEGICNARRVSSPQMSGVDDLHTETLLNDVEGRVTRRVITQKIIGSEFIADKCIDSADKYFPIVAVEVFRLERFYTYDASDMVIDWFTEVYRTLN